MSSLLGRQHRGIWPTAAVVGVPAGVLLLVHAVQPNSHTLPFLWVALGGALAAWRTARRALGVGVVRVGARVGLATGCVATVLAITGLLLLVRPGAIPFVSNVRRAIGITGSVIAHGAPAAGQVVAFVVLGLLAGLLGGLAGVGAARLLGKGPARPPRGAARP